MAYRHALLEDFKNRMRIFHDMEDENLSLMLTHSQEALNEQFGMEVMSKKSGQELILERSRYVYNDKLDLFQGAYAQELHRFSLANTLLEEEYGTKSEETIF